MVFWLAAIAAMGLALWSALRDRSLLSGWRWLTLAVLRLGGMALLALCLWGLDPWRALSPRRKPLVLAVVDGSLSMEREDGLGVTRYQRALADARSLAGRGDAEVRIMAGLESSLGEPVGRARGSFTDMGAWLAKAAALRPDALIMLGDGNNNAGVDPEASAAGYGRPVHVLGYGPLEAGRQPAILDAWAPERVGMGSSAEIRVRLRSGDRPLTLTAEADGRAAGSARIGAGAEVTEVIKHDSDAPGLHRVRLVLSDGSDTLDSRTVSYRSEKDRLKITCLAGDPGWNLRFLKQAVGPAADMDMASFVRKQGKWEGTDWASQPHHLDLSSLVKADLLVMMNMRPSDLGPDVEGAVLEAVRQRGVPVLFLGAGWDESFRSKEIYHLFPLRLNEHGGMRQGRLEMDPTFLSRIILPAGSTEEVHSALKRMPPLRTPIGGAPASKAALVVATITTGGGRIPAWGWWYQGRARVSQLASDDLWAWALGAQGRDAPQGDTTLFGRLVRGTFRWLAGMPGQAVEVGPERGIYYLGEEVRIRGRLPYVSDREATAAASWTVTIHRQGEAGSRRRMAPWRAGEFQASFLGLPCGSYEWSSELSSGGRVTDRSRGLFWIEPSAGEQAGHVQQDGLLKGMAGVSGGVYQSRHVLPDTSGPLEKVRFTAGRDPGRSGPLALALAGLAAIMAEWFWRRRWGLK